MIEYLADSDFLINYLKGRDTEVSLLTPLIQQGSLTTSVIVYGEIYEGLLETRVSEPYRQVLVDVLSGISVLGLDMETAQVFASTRARLRAHQVAGVPRLTLDPLQRVEAVVTFLAERIEGSAGAVRSAHALDEHLVSALGEEPSEDAATLAAVRPAGQDRRHGPPASSGSVEIGQERYPSRIGAARSRLTTTSRVWAGGRAKRAPGHGLESTWRHLVALWTGADASGRQVLHEILRANSLSGAPWVRQ